MGTEIDYGMDRSGDMYETCAMKVVQGAIAIDEHFYRTIGITCA